jgi:hypothetical protein
VLCGETEYLLHPGEVVFVNSNVLHKLKRGQKNVPCRINSLCLCRSIYQAFRRVLFSSATLRRSCAALR